MKKLSSALPVIVVVAIIIALFAWGIASQNKNMTYIPGTNVACLPQGHQNLKTHIHPLMTITMDGIPETLPTDIGITGDCMAEVHTHDTTGTLHVETVDASRLDALTLADFFDVWGTTFEREHFSVSLTVDGEEMIKIDPSMIHFRDGQRFNITYTSIR
ncbi:MAG TPA: hypothetical protein VJ837_03835 [Candidatus Paceibacterota bacterium]|nr:hypothetical protein [Candidatus Paceibacterota bacterium]